MQQCLPLFFYILLPQVQLRCHTCSSTARLCRLCALCIGQKTDTQGDLREPARVQVPAAYPASMPAPAATMKLLSVTSVTAALSPLHTPWASFSSCSAHTQLYALRTCRVLSSLLTQQSPQWFDAAVSLSQSRRAA